MPKICPGRVHFHMSLALGLGSFLARSFEAESFAKLYRNFALKLLVEETSFQVAKLAQMTLNLFTVIKVLIISKFLILSY